MNNLLNNGTVIDVRSTNEFSQGHFPGAINIPLDKIAESIGELQKMKQPIVAYCRSGNRSGMAVNILRLAGLKEVCNAGGLEDVLKLKNLNRD